MFLFFKFNEERMAKEPADKNKKVKRPTPLKRDEQNAKANARNRIVKSRVHTTIRSYEESLAKGDATASKEKLNAVYSVLDKALQKGVLKKNTTSRTKARLTARLSA